MEQAGQIERLLSYIEQDPGNTVLLSNLINTLFENNRPAEAREWLTQAISQHPNDVHILAIQGQLALSDADFSLAAACFQNLLDQGHSHESHYHNLACAHLFLEKPTEALDVLQSLGGQLQHPETQLLLVRCLHQTGQLDQALTALDAVDLSNEGRQELVYGLKALLLLDKEQLSESLLWCNKALAINPQNYDAIIAQAFCRFAQADLALADQSFSQALTLRPKSGRAHLGKGLLLSLSQQLSQAVEHFEAALSDMPDHLGTWNAKAWAELLMGDVDQAAQSLETAKDLEPRFAETQGALAVIAVLREDWEQAERLAKIATRLDKDSFAAQFAQALVIDHKGDSGTAKERLKAIYQRPVTPEGTLESHIQQFIRKR